MKITLKIFLGILFWFTIYSCQNPPKTKSGIEINFIRNGNGQTPRHGDVISLNMTYTSGDMILFDTRKIGAPVQIMFDTSQWKNGGMLYEVLELLEVGDSVQFDIPAINLYEVSFQMPLPDSINSDSDIHFIIGFERAIDQEILNDDRIAARKKIELNILEEYFNNNNISAESTESGLRYVITQPGSGPFPQTGEEVVVHYEGRILGKRVFDSTYGKDPYAFHLGYGRVIEGWDEGMTLFRKGTKATLYVPSSLAYGEEGLGRVIPPNAILEFDVELVDIKRPVGK